MFLYLLWHLRYLFLRFSRLSHKLLFLLSVARLMAALVVRIFKWFCRLCWATSIFLMIYVVDLLAFRCSLSHPLVSHFKCSNILALRDTAHCPFFHCLLQNWRLGVEGVILGCLYSFYWQCSISLWQQHRSKCFIIPYVLQEKHFTVCQTPIFTAYILQNVAFIVRMQTCRHPRAVLLLSFVSDTVLTQDSIKQTWHAACHAWPP